MLQVPRTLDVNYREVEVEFQWGEYWGGIMGTSVQFQLVECDKAAVLECVRCAMNHWIEVSGIDQCQVGI
jgi:hypothetical protein